MAIKGVILDSSNTLVKHGALVPGVQQMVTDLRLRGLSLFIAATWRNEAMHAGRLLSIPHSHLIYRERLIGPKTGKGCKLYVDFACQVLECLPNELIYLGDTEQDMHEAVNSGVLLFGAMWANPAFQRGIPVNMPGDLIALLDDIFLKESLWYYEAEGIDRAGRQVSARALVDADTAINSNIRNLLKLGGGPGTYKLRGYDLVEYLGLHLIASIYLDGLYIPAQDDHRPLWCIYPGHDGKISQVIEFFANTTSRLFNDPFAGGLLVRHTPTKKSAYRRANKEPVILDYQLQTIKLNEACRSRLIDKTVLVVDDFTTDGTAFETTRNLVLNAGANRAIGIAIGKYGRNYIAYSPRPGVQWSSFQSVPLGEDHFHKIYIQPAIDNDALKYFEEP